MTPLLLEKSGHPCNHLLRSRDRAISKSMLGPFQPPRGVNSKLKPLSDCHSKVPREVTFCRLTTRNVLTCSLHCLMGVTSSRGSKVPPHETALTQPYIYINRKFRPTDRRSCRNLNPYLVGAQFEFRPEHGLFCH